MSDVLSTKVVVSNGLVVAIHEVTYDLYNLYPTTCDWFTWSGQLATDHVTTGTTVSYLDGFNILPNPSSIGPSDPTGIANITPSLPLPFVAQVTANKTIRLGTIADPRLSMTLSACQAAKISMVTDIFTHQIQAAYPLATQSQIEAQVSPYNSTSLSTMVTFINGKNTAMTTEIAAINALTTVAAVIAYNAYPSGYP